MEQPTRCPFCGKSLTAAEYAALRERIRKAEDPAILAEFESVRREMERNIKKTVESEYLPLRTQLDAYVNREKELNQRATELDLRDRAIGTEVAKKLNDERAALSAEVERRVRDEAQLSSKQKDAEILRLTKEASRTKQDFEERITAEIRVREPNLRAEMEQEFQRRQAGALAKLKEYQARELELETTRGDLELKEQGIELEVQKRLSGQREAIFTAASQQARETYEMNAKEKDRKIEMMNKQIAALNERSHSASPQDRGYIQQADLAKYLTELYSADGDEVRETKRGVNGADILHKVKLRSGAVAGIILWESKRAKDFNPSWIEKLREDQREQKADIAAIVSHVIPDEINYFAIRDNVIVAHVSIVDALSSILRQQLIGLARHKMTQEQRQGKVDELFAYMTGNEFHQRICGIAEAIFNLEGLTEQEVRAHNRSWGHRRKIHERLAKQTALLYGEVSGIVGTLSPVPQLELPESADVLEGKGDVEDEDIPF